MAINSPVAALSGGGDYLSQLIALSQGISGTNGSKTSKTTVSPDGLNRIIQSALQGQGGLAGIFSAPAISGGYNSNTKSMMANDLLSRISAEAAAKTVGVTETSRQGGVGASGVLKALALKEGSKLGANALKSLINGGSGAVGKNMAGFFDTSSVFPSTEAGTNTLSDWLASSGSSGGELGLSGSITGMEGLGSSAGAGASFIDGVNPYAGAASALLNAADGEWGGNDTFSTIGATVGSYFGPIGSAVGSWIGNTVGENAMDGTESYLANSGGGLFTGDASVKDVIGSGFGLGDIFDTDKNAVTDVWNGIKSLGDGCFITTAVCQSTGKPDDCEELTTLREFRDSYVAPNYPELVEQYYREAPGIVTALQSQTCLNQDWYWNHLYVRYIKPAVAFIQASDQHSALAVYHDLFTEVSAQAGA